MKKKRRIHIPLRFYVTVHSIGSLLLACILSFCIVCGSMAKFYHGELTHEILMLMTLASCVLMLIIGMVFMWLISGRLIKPIVRISQGVNKVATGDFSVRIEERKKKRSHIEFYNEIDSLAQNFNAMAEDLNGMDYMRKEFISNVSHEVKTPIASITGFTEILLDGGLSREEETEYLKLVHEEAIRLSGLCESMLVMSRLDNQEIVKSEDEIRLDEQLRKAVILLSEKWSEQECEFDLNLTPVTVVSNADLLLQVWINLIDNAIKYSMPLSTIEITVTDDKDWATVEIKDYGRGIEPEKLTRIYDRFYQCEESHKKSGNGLGLSIVHRIIELLGARVFCESTSGIGTTMTVVLPHAQEKNN